MASSPEVHAAIIRVSGDWALAVAKAKDDYRMPVYFKQAYNHLLKTVLTRE
jgi:hypothetical protein